MKKEYDTILNESLVVYEDRKSKFISRAKPVSSEEDAIFFINSIKEKHRDATHNVYAYSVEEDGILRKRFTDDGEPSGTSGKPTLEAIDRLNLLNVVVVTTRYFGGTLLGTAGLIRAYGKSAKLSLEQAKIVKMVYRTKIKVICEYTLLGVLQNLIEKLGYTIESINYNTDVDMFVLVPQNEVDPFIKKVINETNDRVLWERLEDAYVVEQ